MVDIHIGSAGLYRRTFPTVHTHSTRHAPGKRGMIDSMVLNLRPVNGGGISLIRLGSYRGC